MLSAQRQACDGPRSSAVGEGRHETAPVVPSDDQSRSGRRMADPQSRSTQTRVAITSTLLVPVPSGSKACVDAHRPRSARWRAASDGCADAYAPCTGSSILAQQAPRPRRRGTLSCAGYALSCVCVCVCKSYKWEHPGTSQQITAAAARLAFPQSGPLGGILGFVICHGPSETTPGRRVAHLSLTVS